jgi:beta-aspartyl-peptidase (threonine type)
MGTYAFAVHGGAGFVRRHSLPPAEERAALEVLRLAVDAGTDVLARGGDALDACLAAVVVLEEAPMFNAGRGGVFAADGAIWHDASVMHGRDRSAGGVTATHRIRNPVLAADLVRRHSGHVLLAGPAAEAFVAAHGAELVDPSFFFVQERWDHFEKARAAGVRALDHDLEGDNEPKGTVGAVARDVHGHVAAATSTGGLANKLPGRVGDSPIVGAGTWAWDATCAVSCTGVGEAMMRTAAAARISDWIDLGGASLAEAASRVVHHELIEVGGVGGVIAVDAAGRIEMPFNAAGMYRGFRDTEGRIDVAVW